MAYDEPLAWRVRRVAADIDGDVTERALERPWVMRAAEFVATLPPK